MLRLSECIQKVKTIRMDITGNAGKFHQNLNLLLVIILALLVPELAVLVGLAWLFGWLNVVFQQSENVTTA
jgi:hypothetical protein